MDTEHRLDLKGLNCPLPVLRANKLMKQMMPGDTLEIEVTDPAAPKDFETYCHTTGNELLACETFPDHFLIKMRKKQR